MEEVCPVSGAHRIPLLNSGTDMHIAADPEFLNTDFWVASGSGEGRRPGGILKTNL
jgi:hypothetical protein